MRGTIVHYNAIEGRGLIATRAGEQVAFGIQAWRSGVSPRPDQVVELEAAGLQAVAVHLVPLPARIAERVRRAGAALRPAPRRRPPAPGP